MFALNGKYPLDTPQHIKQASAYFEQNWRSFFPENRREYALRTAYAADQKGVEVDPMIQKYASAQFNPYLKQMLEKRKSLVPEATEAFDKMASFIGQSDVDEWASVLRDLDRKYGLESAYHKGGIGDYLHDSLGDYEAPIQKEAGWQLSIGQKTYTQKDLARALSHPSVITQYGEANINQFKNPAVFDSLPMEDKEIILEHSV